MHVFSLSTAGLSRHDRVLVRSLSTLLTSRLQQKWVITDSDDICHALLIDIDLPGSDLIISNACSQKKSPVVIHVTRQFGDNHLSKPIRSQQFVETLNRLGNKLSLDKASVIKRFRNKAYSKDELKRFDNNPLSTQRTPLLERLRNRLLLNTHKTIKVVFLGPPGAGKTTAIKTVGESAVITSEVKSTDQVGMIKSNTTVAIDHSTVNLPNNYQARLFGAPGQARLSFMWPILARGADLIVLFCDATDIDFFEQMQKFSKLLSTSNTCVALTHTDLETGINLDQTRQMIASLGMSWPVHLVDARNKQQVITMLTRELEASRQSIH